jgi:FtsP/CotA-like multicopper oxidase with cupredoxin domain
MASWKEKLALIAQRNRREIVKAKLSRREMMRLGLLTASGSLVAKQGLSAGITSSNDGTLNTDGRLLRSVDLTPPSPPAPPWVQPMPIIPQKMPVPPTAISPQPDGFTLIERATKSVPHQFFTFDPKTKTYGGQFPPKKFYEMNLSEFQVQLHPDFGKGTTVWGFDNGVPGPVIHATYGEPVLLRISNNLPSVRIPQDFGIAENAIHLHNAHTPTESDGYPLDYVNSSADKTAISPGFKDHHFLNVYAGFVAAKNSIGDPAEALGSLWYHDHHIDFTAQNVYKGMFGGYLLFDDQDTGNEATGLRLPSGKYDVPIFFNDFLLDDRAQLVFDLFNLDGILGDRFCANGAIQPFFNVDKRRYRLRLYNPGPSRWWEFALFDGTKFLPFWQISNDGNLLPQAVPVTSVRLSVAKRVDIIVDFSKIAASRIYLVNRLEQVNGRGPTGKILTPGTPVVQINIGNKAPDYSRDPADGKPFYLRALPDPDFAALFARAAKAKTRVFRFERGNGAWQINGKFFDENVVNANPAQESEEVWVFQNGGGGWAHPIHAHFEECRVLSHNGVPVQPNTSIDGYVAYSRGDVLPLMINEEYRCFSRFRDMKGRYVMHCHNVVHEDHAMMIRYDIV